MQRNILFFLIYMISFQAVAAWDGVVTGTIRQVDVAALNGDNAGFRVTLDNSPTLCGNEHHWAYINKSDDNYQATVSVLLAAKMSGRSVGIHSNKDGSSSDYCHIGYVIVY